MPALLAGREPFDRRSAWAWLIENARWQDGCTDIEGKTVLLLRGQMSFSFRFLAKAWKWQDSRVRRFIQRLIDDGEVLTATDYGTTVITIVKYLEYSFGNDVTDASSPHHRLATAANYKQGNIKQDEGNMLEAGSGKPPPALSVTPGETGQGSLLPTASVHLMPTVATRFDEFYQAYPRKVARPAAFKAYKRAVEDAPHVELMAGLKRFDWSGNPKYYPYPATWLNNRRWADGATNVPEEEVRVNDPQGIQSWCQSLPGVEPTVTDGDRAFGNWMLGGWILDEVARLVAGAVELPTPCRMEWSLLRAWLDDGMEPEFIVARIEENVTWLRRKGYYHAPSSLALFDAFVRGARKSA